MINLRGTIHQVKKTLDSWEIIQMCWEQTTKRCFLWDVHQDLKEE